MKKIVLFVLAACAVSVIASAQEHLTYTFEKKISADQAPQIKIAGSQVTMAFEMKSVPNAPYQGEAVTESVMTLADGNRIVKKTTTRVYRDSAGRTRKETVGADGQVTSVFITDPVGKTSYSLDPASQTASRTAVYYFTHASGGEPPAGATITHAAVAPGGGTVTVSTSSGAGAATWTAAGAAGTPGSRGSEVGHRDGRPGRRLQGRRGVQPGEGRREGGARRADHRGRPGQGHPHDVDHPGGRPGQRAADPDRVGGVVLAELQVLVMTKHSDPRVGETTYRLVNISRTEPAKSLFELPAGYTIKTPEAGHAHRKYDQARLRLRAQGSGHAKAHGPRLRHNALGPKP